MSVRKRTWKTAAGEAREAWIVDYVDQQGERHIKTFDRKKDADACHSTVNVEVGAGVHTPESRSMTVTEAGRLWLATGEKNGLERATLQTYREHLNLHVVPYLGHLKLAQLSAPMIREFEDKLRAGTPAPGQSGGTKRSKAMTRKILGSLGSIVADAQERGLIARNVVRDLRSRRRRGKESQADGRKSGKLKFGVDIPTWEEIEAIVAHLHGRYRPLLLTAIFTGLRASELRGLRWEDVDLKRGELHVRQRADRYNEIGRPKTKAGDRTVPIPRETLNVLREWKLACPKGELGLVFPTGKGNIEHHANIVQRGLAPAQVAAGVVTKDGRAKYTGLHALRHFYASWCINREADKGIGLPAKIVQERLGHSTIGMTMDVYGHLFPREDHSSEMTAAESAFFKRDKNATSGLST